MWPGQPYQYMQQPQMYQQMQYQSAVPTEVIDWDAVSSIDPDLIRRTGDLTQIQPFISRFVGANLGQYESQVLTHPLAVRLCSILQVSLQYMSDVQRQLDDKVKRLETKLEDKNEEFKKLEIAFTKADDLLRRKMQSTEKCPICLKKFKNFDFVDQHFERRHPEHLEEWYSLRNKRPIRERQQHQQRGSDIDHIVKQIADLQNTIRRDREEKARNLPVIPPAKQAKPTKPTKQQEETKPALQKEVFRKQQELLKTEQEQEDLEMTHRDDMKSELDAAVDELNMSWAAWKEQTHKPEAPPKRPKSPKKPQNDEDEFAQDFYRGHSGDDDFSSDNEKIGVTECQGLNEKPKENPFKFAMLQTSEIEVEPALVQTIKADEIEPIQEDKEPPKPKKKKKGGFFHNLFRRKKQEVEETKPPSPRRNKSEPKEASIAKQMTPRASESRSSSKIPDSVRRTFVNSSRKSSALKTRRESDQAKLEVLKDAKRFLIQKEQDQFNSEVVAHAIEVIQDRVVSKMKKFKPSLPPDEVAAKLKKEDKNLGNTYQEINDRLANQLSLEYPLPKGSPQHIEMPSEEERYVDDAVEYEYEYEEEEEVMELEEMTVQEEPKPQPQKAVNPMPRQDPVRRSHFKSCGQPIGEPQLSRSKQGLLAKPGPKKKNYDISGIFEGSEEDELDRPTLQLTSLSSSDSLNQFEDEEPDEKKDQTGASYVDGSHESLFESPKKSSSVLGKREKGPKQVMPNIVPAVEYEYEYEEEEEEAHEPILLKPEEHVKSPSAQRSPVRESFDGKVDTSPKVTRYSPEKPSQQLDTDQLVRSSTGSRGGKTRESFASNVTSFIGDDAHETSFVEIESEDIPPPSAPSPVREKPTRKEDTKRQELEQSSSYQKGTSQMSVRDEKPPKKEESETRQPPKRQERSMKPSPPRKQEIEAQKLPKREESDIRASPPRKVESQNKQESQIRQPPKRQEPERPSPPRKAEAPKKQDLDQNVSPPRPKSNAGRAQSSLPARDEKEESLIEISTEDIEPSGPATPPRRETPPRRYSPTNRPTIKMTRAVNDSTKPALPSRAVAPFQFDSDEDEEDDVVPVTQGRIENSRAVIQEPPHEYEYEYEYEEDSEGTIPFAPPARQQGTSGGLPRMINAGPLLGILKKPPPRRADALDDESFSATKTMTLKSKLHQTFADPPPEGDDGFEGFDRGPAPPEGDDGFEGFDRGPAPPEGDSESESGEMQSYFKPEASAQMSGWQESFGDSKFVDVDSSEGPSMLRSRSSRGKKDSFISDGDMHV